MAVNPGLGGSLHTERARRLTPAYEVVHYHPLRSNSVNDREDDWEDQRTNDISDGDSESSSDHQQDVQSPMSGQGNFKVVLDSDSASTVSSGILTDTGIEELPAVQVTALPKNFNGNIEPISKPYDTFSNDNNIYNPQYLNPTISPNGSGTRPINNNNNKKARFSRSLSLKDCCKSLLPSFCSPTAKQFPTEEPKGQFIPYRHTWPRSGTRKSLRLEIGTLQQTIEDLKLQNDVYKDQVKAITQDWYNTEKELTMERYKRFEIDMENFRLKLTLEGREIQGSRKEDKSS